MIQLIEVSLSLPENQDRFHQTASQSDPGKYLLHPRNMSVKVPYNLLLLSESHHKVCGKVRCLLFPYPAPVPVHQTGSMRSALFHTSRSDLYMHLQSHPHNLLLSYFLYICKALIWYMPRLQPVLSLFQGSLLPHILTIIYLPRF